MSHNITTTINRHAQLSRLKPTVADMKEFIAEVEAAGIKDTVQVRIEQIGEILGVTYKFSVEEHEEVPQNVPTEERA